MMARVKASTTWTGKLLAAGANKCYQGGEYGKNPDRLTQLRRVATRLVLEDLTDGISNASDVVCVLVGSLSGLVERSGPGLRSESRVQAVCKSELPVKDALAAVASKDPTAATSLAAWIVGAVNDREDDARKHIRQKFVQDAKQGLKAPAVNIWDALKPLAKPAGYAAGLWLAFRVLGKR